MGKRLIFFVNGIDNFITHRLPLVKAVLNQGYEVFLLLPSDESKTRLEALQLPITLLPINLKRKSLNLGREIKTLRQVQNYFQVIKPDIVISVALKAALYSSIAAMQQRHIKVINIITGLGYLFISTKKSVVVVRNFLKLGFRLVSRWSNAELIFQNNDDIIALLGKRGLHKQNVHLIKGSGVDVQKFHPLPQPVGEVVVVILPARMLVHKGIYEFVAAAKQLQQQNITARFVLVGGIDNDNPVAISKAEIEQWCAAGIVEWWGYQSDMLAVFAQAHIICLPSYREGLPKVLLEAAACERALITTDVPGCREVVEQGVNGFLVPLHEVTALADGIGKLIKDSELRLRFAQRARLKAEQEFADTIVVKKALAVINL